MLKHAPFIHKLLKRIERLDRDSLKTHLQDLVRENTLYDEILEHLKEGVILVNPQGHIDYANRQASLWLALPSVFGNKDRIQDLVTEREVAQFIAGHLENLKEGAVGDFPVLFPREINLRVFLTPLENKQAGKKILILLLNIPANARTDEKDKPPRIEALMSLVAGIAHELGNPLNSIAIHLQLLKKELEDYPPKKKKILEKTLDVLNSETSRLDKIVKNFLKATRKSPLRFRSEDLNAILSEALDLMAPELKKKKINVYFQPDPALLPFLMDRSRLYQTFTNLIKNAMEAMPRGGDLWMNISSKENVARIRFKDTGIGIPESDLPHIFEAYYTTKEEGSGLGLMAVFSAVREHGGRIEVISKPGKGTTFVILLPIRLAKLQLPMTRSKTE
ncbi:MAG TPA: ATP-binding protein [bacterium]|nr:ATP-binding protein [bacterium]